MASSATLRGSVRAELSLASDRPSHDVCCVLSVVFADGRVVSLTSGYLRVADSTAPSQRCVDMRATFCTVPAGAALRLSVQAAAFPAFAVNPGTGRRPEDAATAEAVTTTIAIATGAGSGSCLFLPLADAADRYPSS
jgi:predicted acyl esterase